MALPTDCEAGLRGRTTSPMAGAAVPSYLAEPIGLTCLWRRRRPSYSLLRAASRRRSRATTTRGRSTSKGKPSATARAKCVSMTSRGSFIVRNYSHLRGGVPRSPSRDYFLGSISQRLFPAAVPKCVGIPSTSRISSPLSSLPSLLPILSLLYRYDYPI